MKNLKKFKKYSLENTKNLKGGWYIEGESINDWCGTPVPLEEIEIGDLEMSNTSFLRAINLYGVRIRR